MTLQDATLMLAIAIFFSSVGIVLGGQLGYIAGRREGWVAGIDYEKQRHQREE